MLVSFLMVNLDDSHLWHLKSFEESNKALFKSSHTQDSSLGEMLTMENSNRRSIQRPSKIDPLRRESEYFITSLSSCDILVVFIILLCYFSVMETMNHLYFLMGGDQLKACWYFQKLYRLPRSVREFMMLKVAEYHSRNEQWFTFDDQYYTQGVEVNGEMYPQFDMSRLPEEMQIYLPPLETVSPSTDSVRRAVKRIRLSSFTWAQTGGTVIPKNKIKLHLHFWHQ